MKCEHAAMAHARRPIWSSARRLQRAFTLVELLVVISIIALLIAILLPSLKRARKQAQAIVCASNCKQLHLALFTYQGEFNGFIPHNLWSERDWGVAKGELWFYKLFPTYLGDPNALICPGDPFRQTFDFESNFPFQNFPKRSNARANSCGYGMNYLIRHLGEPQSFNLEAYNPRRPAQTILFAEVGPDYANPTAPLPDNLFGVGRPWRDGGRIVWDDGARPWYAGPTWLTARHAGTIDIASMDGAIHRVDTADMVKPQLNSESQIMSFYENCAAGDCLLCNLGTDKNYGGTVWRTEAHYDFSHARLYWWTGPIPRYAN